MKTFTAIFSDKKYWFIEDQRYSLGSGIGGHIDISGQKVLRAKEKVIKEKFFTLHILVFSLIMLPTP